MVEGGENQALKRTRFEEEHEDGISALPVCLLVEILSRLPSTTEAIRTGTLSKRWKHLWTCVTNLIFEQPLGILLNPDFFSFIDKTLTQRRQSKLNNFSLHCYYNINLQESRINSWIHYAVSCNVEDLHLTIWGVKGGIDFPLAESVLINSCFTRLTLSGCTFNPTGAISWEKLRILRITFMKLDEDVIENIVSGSPVLETLVLKYCYGYRRLDITSKSLKNLVFSAYRDFSGSVEDPAAIIEINAPNILTLKIEDYLDLRKLLLLNVSSLVEANLDYVKFFGHYEATPKEAEAEEEMLKGLILNLRHVKDLKIGNSCSKVLARLKAKGFISPLNLKANGEMRIVD